MENQKIIENIKSYSQYICDILDLIERAASYKTRQYIKLSDKEIKNIIQDGINNFIICVRNLICAEALIEDKGLGQEYLTVKQDVIDEFKKLQELAGGKKIDKIENMLDKPDKD